MPLLFSYGMLQQEAVQLSTFGRLLHGHDDELVGFEPARVKIDDPQVAAETGETHYDNALFNGNPDSRVSGMVFEVTDDELAAADKFEQRAAYTRVNARLASGKQTWVYVEARSAADTAELELTREIVWRLRLAAPPQAVFALLATDEGRASFWAERTEQKGNDLTFYFPNGEVLASRVYDVRAPERLSVSYFNGSTVTFELRPAGSGTDLCLRESGVAAETVHENQAGWVSVLMNLKAQADHRVDLRNHDGQCCWDNGYVDN